MAACFFLHSGSVWEQGNVSTVVFLLRDSGTTCFQHPLFLFLIIQVSHSLVFMDERCEVSVLTNRKSEEQRGCDSWRRCVRAYVCVYELPPLLSCYSSSSLCFLPLTGPCPFLREPFWGRRRCPRSCSVHGTPPCPSSLSRSESECMRAEEVGAGTGFKRAGLCMCEEKEDRKKW